MVPQKQQAILDDLNSCIKALTKFGFEYATNVDRKDSNIPSEDIEGPIVNLLTFVIRSHKEDFANLLKLYDSGGLWRKAIRKALLMDDPEEKGYWFYHVYGNKPNTFFKLYMEEHFPIALEKVLEMFERGYREEFLELKFDAKEIANFNLFDHGIREILNIIDERYGADRLKEVKSTGKFLAWLYLLDKKRMEKVLQEYESVVDDDLNEMATVCRYTLAHEAPEQTKLQVA